MERLKQHDNILAVYPLILERMKGIEGVKAVKEVGEIAELVAGAEKRKVSPLDGAVYVVYGGETVAETARKGTNIRHTLHFTFVLAKTYTANGRSVLTEAGKTLTAIQQSFSGWNAGNDYVVSPFVRAASPSIEYNDGFALFPISFTVEAVSIPSEI